MVISQIAIGGDGDSVGAISQLGKPYALRVHGYTCALLPGNCLYNITLVIADASFFCDTSLQVPPYIISS